MTCTPCFYIGSLKWFKLFEWRDFAFWNKRWEKAYRAGQHNFLFCIRLLICFFMEVFKSIYYIITPTNSLQLYRLSRSFGKLWRTWHTVSDVSGLYKMSELDFWNILPCLQSVITAYRPLILLFLQEFWSFVFSFKT